MEKSIEKLYKTIIKDGIDEYKDLLEKTNLGVKSKGEPK